MKIKRLWVDTPQGVSGILDRESRFVFNYVSTERPCEASLTMPIRPESYASQVLPPIFEMNRPEGYLLDRIRQKFAKEGSLDDMALLKITGNNQVGRLRYRDQNSKAERSNLKGVGLKEILHEGASKGLFEFLVETYLESGISGVQPKVMAPDVDKSPIATDKATLIAMDLIVKSSGEYPGLTGNEFLCMDAARRAGITVPEFWLSQDATLFVMRRFDLADEKQLGFEDMAVIMNKQAENKYVGSYENIAKAIKIFCRNNALESSRQFFEYLTLSVLTRNGDAHLKNFGLLYETPDAEGDRSPRLAPLYDVVTTTAFDIVNIRTGETKVDRTLALKLNGVRTYPARETLIRFGRDTCGVRNAGEVIDRISQAMSETLKEQSSRLEVGLADRIASEWEKGMSSLSAPIVYAK